MAELFTGTVWRGLQTGTADIAFLTGGAGPPLLLLHGFPQTHAMWHRVAPALMTHFTCVIPDLPGYGASRMVFDPDVPASYSKRSMADELVRLMEVLGFSRFAVAGHDRGGRAAYRMALDHPGAVSRLAVLDIVPTFAMWHGFSVPLAMKAYHWLFLAQPSPLPEMLIGRAPAKWLDYTMASWTKARDLSGFDRRAMAAYRKAFGRREVIAAACNDYRAGATIDLADDEADRAAGRRIACPVLALWGTAGFPAATEGPLAAWRDWADDLAGAGIDAGHFVAEENPHETLAHLLPFLLASDRAAG